MGARMFRYAEVLGWQAGPLDARCITARAIGAPFDHEASHLACSDPRLEKVWTFCKTTIAHTTADVFTGLPDQGTPRLRGRRLRHHASHFSTEGSSGKARRVPSSTSWAIPAGRANGGSFFIPLFP